MLLGDEYKIIASGILEDEREFNIKTKIEARFMSKEEIKKEISKEIYFKFNSKVLFYTTFQMF